MNPWVFPLLLLLIVICVIIFKLVYRSYRLEERMQQLENKLSRSAEVEQMELENDRATTILQRYRNIQYVRNRNANA